MAEVFRGDQRSVVGGGNQVGRVVELLEFGAEVKSGWGLSMHNEVGGCGRETGGANEVMRSGGHRILVVRFRVAFVRSGVGAWGNRNSDL